MWRADYEEEEEAERKRREWAREDERATTCEGSS